MAIIRSFESPLSIEIACNWQYALIHKLGSNFVNLFKGGYEIITKEV
ncbi:Uncharacterised protein [[Clostridium] sordellii]|nr:hypothetical protein [Paeniclostridium sordellii]CEQ26519.1 Uncharacterised protein [[Clostridium] sordellii] [Paeniclostridium sordellii]